MGTLNNVHNTHAVESVSCDLALAGRKPNAIRSLWREFIALLGGATLAHAGEM
jgi:hypothetical protein